MGRRSIPRNYLTNVRAELAPDVTTVAIPDPVSVAAGLLDQLAAAPARLLIVNHT